MTSQEPEARPQFADTVTGKIVVGLAVAAGSALIGWIVSRATYEPPAEPRPDVQISPSTIVAQANEVVEFSAEGSSVPSSAAPAYSWSIGGLEPNKSPIANCQELTAVIRCRFALPGTFAVSVTVLDANGQSGSAAASVTVSIPNGYLAVYARSVTPEARRALAYDVDWVSLQTLVGRPIILDDPETGAPVYAVLVQAPSGNGTPPDWRGAAAGLKVAIPRLSPEAQTQFEVALGRIGIVPITLPLGEIQVATERGAVDLGFLPVDSPDALARLSSEGER